MGARNRNLPNVLVGYLDWLRRDTLSWPQFPLLMPLVRAALCAALGIVLALSACGTTRDARAPSDLPSAGAPARRFTGEVIGADLAYFDKLQQRLAQLRRTNSDAYHTSKAQAWLDVAREEYRHNDRTPVIENALVQAEILVGALEMKSTTINPQTPHIPGSAPIRDDLWQKAARAKRHPGFKCAAQTVAQLEVQLVWASYELKQAGWRHASTYIQSAEDLSQRLERQLARC